ncbi:uncharacterized protein YndB with AHSA1/START domain [Herbihabitans rhizosphaerae]|uniref:Uncharacterized protein YndB with AHSA1/START domain n=1 Tax=Herbihabitans rhizosphaerae TaxID=1872711 RepID=A0A4Q7L652_9PSEU|nr:SRPBCC domain-containing protein [Herbihabitans rhizosphaerae]RZS44817.1 uncharacterized protein YndB with AHSA1/START domain [Herbihabitans rhizosphaerae]
MTNATKTETTQIYSVYIKADAKKVWDAITQREWTEKYGYGGYADYSKGTGRFETHPSQDMIDAGKANGYEIPDVIIEGEILAYDPPTKLALTWHMLMDPETAKESFTKLTYEIKEVPGGVKLTVTHDLEGAPVLAAVTSGSQEELGAGGGWAWILSDLKSLIETGEALSPR